MFMEMHKHNGEPVIITVDNSTNLVEKEGDMVIVIRDDIKNKSIKLNEVYHVPGLTRNLVSISQITNSRKYMLFGPSDVKVLDNMKNIYVDIVLIGERNDPYLLYQQVKLM